ncbi:DUF4307 domain-containing protein [Haloglycomyces albus]|uniref:DUF4307 domain-containing protein n=1 Tax=Haloglycomyces albus TaxID=526067 RepID=UPI000A05215C|nr:DUF4307 domain-containing protein [Haloglycomyces albus]
MTATSERRRDSAPSFPPGRYGRRREPRKSRKWIAVGLTGAVVAIGIVVALRMEYLYGSEYSADVLAFSSEEGYVEVTFVVNKPAGEGATCRVRSRDVAGAEIGHAEVEIPASEARRTQVTYKLTVEGTPNTGEVQRCWPTELTLLVKAAAGHFDSAALFIRILSGR